MIADCCASISPIRWRSASRMAGSHQNCRTDSPDSDSITLRIRSCCSSNSIRRPTSTKTSPPAYSSRNRPRCSLSSRHAASMGTESSTSKLINAPRVETLIAAGASIVFWASIICVCVLIVSSRFKTQPEASPPGYNLQRVSRPRRSYSSGSPRHARVRPCNF